MELSWLQGKDIEFYRCVPVTKLFIPHHPRHCCVILAGKARAKNGKCSIWPAPPAGRCWDQLLWSRPLSHHHWSFFLSFELRLQELVLKDSSDEPALGKAEPSDW